MISDRIELDSVLLPFHLSVVHIRKNNESNLPTEYGFQFFLCCPCWCEHRLIEFDGTVSDKIAGSTNCHLETIFFVCSPNIIHIQYSCIMIFLVHHNRHQKVSRSSYVAKLLLFCKKLGLGGHFVMPIQFTRIISLCGCIGQPSTVIFIGLIQASLWLIF